ncbi:LOW QUALITY PROTEIN: hypothetical protein Thini_2054 [Thiothrix nivea DSM 5205]|uniref:Pili assembly chaperone N-terminal domain-containing protein n=2 Tax=Thiothrix nivea TaxID=1031 RepID=A0A656HGK3_THINJ|nr:LOW QUALITY PROTEIN: hypothetical protein Thini_2054 [Thiothrix nivea DSM 5205]
MKYKNKWLWSCLLLLAGLASTTAMAKSFEIAVSPSRFEISGDGGKRIGQSIEIQNVGSTATEVTLRTLDWSYTPDGRITYYDELRPGSCRPWITLERSSVKIGAKGKKSFRFQAESPPNTPRTECRFMLAVEGIEPAHKTIVESGGASLSLPVSGRIAVAVYLAVNGAEPKLGMTQVAMQDVGGKRTPVVTVNNTGDAHGRLGGSLEAVDSNGQAFELVPEGTPIMPGQTRVLPLSARAIGGGKTPLMAFPVKATGAIDWEKGSFKVNAEFR